ncbi:ABC transporter substrate-binding protein [Pseudoflavonifractor sp. AF19-9AC]|uniref:ABC transporter substrate-binding protein n=1 Tax=Pseudoflavonifractor sp. AF19-9AC TaxID=2292244 RepID=UPI000E4D2414|nr:MqnA/MqnD/SBP family protein [Pseudoflavonifractor sp. AF19-9AC]RHR10403.1 ABC transporter substrate-binding protein [Pseudoflavonifractor sp. AF19-9AC]
MKKPLSLLLCAALALSLLAGCGPKSTSSSSSGSASSAGSSSSASSSQETPDLPTLNFMALSGPTGVGAAQMMSTYDVTAENPDTSLGFLLNSSVEADNQVVSNALINKDADIAAMATNVAATLYAKTDGAIQVLCVNTLGVLYILEKGDSVHAMTDLAGKTVYATGQGANPEYVLNYLLTKNGVDPASVDIQWMTAQEVSAKMTSSEEAICMLPVPAATALMLQDSGVRQAISLSSAWDKLEQGPLPQGCLVARTEYVEEHPEEVAAFLKAYEASITYMSDEANLDSAAQMVAQFGITANDKVAAAAIPQCNLTYLAGSEMKQALETYYQVLVQADPASVGNAMPYDSFYYGAD